MPPETPATHLGPSVSADAFKKCGVCGLEYQRTLSHGAVDCFAEFRYQIARLTRERNVAQIKLDSAETTLRAVRRALDA